MHRRQSRLGTSLAAAALPFALLAGCAGDDPQPRFPEETASSPTEASSPEPTEPTPPPAMEGDDEAAAEAFVEYYFDLLAYAQATGDIAPANAIALRDCAACAGALKGVKDTYESGGSIEGGDFSLSGIQVDQQGAFANGGRSFAATARVDTTRQVIKGSSNKSLNGVYPAGHQRIQFLFAHSEDGWRMARWSIL